jgi:DNA-binding beta-propeller fold protein YncE
MKDLIISLILIFTILSCSSDTENSIRIVAGSGEAGFIDGKQSVLNKPIRFAPYTDNSVIFADINNHAIRIASLDGEVSTIAGGPDKKGYQDGPASEAKFNSPHGVAYDPEKDIIYVAEAGNHLVRQITKSENGEYLVSTLAGKIGGVGFKDGLSDSAQFISPHAVILNKDGGVFVADIGNARVRLVKDGIVSTIAGSGNPGESDGQPNEASFKYVMDIVADGESILLADAGNHLIRRIIPYENVTTIKMKDTLNTPHGIAVDENNNIYIADMGTHRILKINDLGQVTTIAGTGYKGSKQHELNKPAAVLVHGDYLWIADLENHQIKVINIVD